MQFKSAGLRMCLVCGRGFLKERENMSQTQFANRLSCARHQCIAAIKALTAKILYPERRKSLIESNTGEKHHAWKGDNAGYSALHIFIKTHFPKPDFCQICNEVPPVDLANITGIYDRDFSNYQYLCKKCHQDIDKQSEKCRNLGLSMKGKPGFFRGKKRSVEFGKAVSEGKKGHSVSQKTRKKLSKSVKALWKNGVYRYRNNSKREIDKLEKRVPQPRQKMFRGKVLGVVH